MNFKVLEHAVKMVKDKFNIDFMLTNCRIEQFPEVDTTFGNFTAHIKAPPTIKLELTTTEDHGSWNEYTDLEYVIFEKDLLDESEVDKVIGGNISGYELEMRMALRLAFIIYNGLIYGLKREQRKDYIDKGWHPRVVSVKMRY